MAAGLAKGSELRNSRGRVQTVKDDPEMAGRIGIWKCRTHLATLSPEELQTCTFPPVALLSIAAPFKNLQNPTRYPIYWRHLSASHTQKQRCKNVTWSSHNYIYPDLLSSGWPAPAQRIPVSSQHQGGRGPRWEF